MLAECSQCGSRFQIPKSLSPAAGALLLCSNCQATSNRASESTQVTPPRFSFEYVERDPSERPASVSKAPRKGSAGAKTSSPELAQELFGDLNLPDPNSPPDDSGGLLQEAMFELSMQAQTAPVPRASPLTLQSEARSVFLARQAQAKTERESGERFGAGARKMSVRLVQLLFGLILGVLMVASLGAYLNDGHLDLSSVSWLGLRALAHSPGEVVAADLSSGLYDTRAGKPIFYVRGTVENHGREVRTVKVRAEILDGAQLVRAVEGMAGVTPTPEDLYRIEDAAAADALNSQASAEGGKVGPGARVPFLLAFYDYPPDLWAYRLKVLAFALSAGVAKLP